MLCRFSHKFPFHVAKLLERDRHLKRKFREETLTDLLMAALVGFRPYGIRVDYPDEPTTGGDMEWYFVGKDSPGRTSYIRLVLQAKRAQFSHLKKGGYWLYKNIDYKKGKQAQTLTKYANQSKETTALYILYNPTSALQLEASEFPCVLGINLIFADIVAKIVTGGCSTSEKKIDFWRPHFMYLEDFLCWPEMLTSLPRRQIQFLQTGQAERMLIETMLTASFHPIFIARRIKILANKYGSNIDISVASFSDDEVAPFNSDDISRPRAIFQTNISPESDDFREMEKRLFPQND